MMPVAQDMSNEDVLVTCPLPDDLRQAVMTLGASDLEREDTPHAVEAARAGERGGRLRQQRNLGRRGWGGAERSICVYIYITLCI